MVRVEENRLTPQNQQKEKKRRNWEPTGALEIFLRTEQFTASRSCPTSIQHKNKTF